MELMTKFCKKKLARFPTWEIQLLLNVSHLESFVIDLGSHEKIFNLYKKRISNQRYTIWLMIIWIADWMLYIPQNWQNVVDKWDAYLNEIVIQKKKKEMKCIAI